VHQFIKAVILGVVEGLTEFLPISSTGHLILINQWIAFDSPFTNMFNIVIQLGAILSVIVYFRSKLNPWGDNLTKTERKNIINLWKKTVVAIIPAGILGGLFGDVIEEYLFNPLVVSMALLFGGIFLLYLESRNNGGRIRTLEALSYSTAFMIGIIQCLAMIPGTSRSAATIIGAMLLGASRTVAAEFSFFLAIPTMLGASVYALMKSGAELTSVELMTLAIGFIVSFLVAWVVIAGFMNFIRKHSFKPFAYYRMALGGFILAYFLIR